MSRRRAPRRSGNCSIIQPAPLRTAPLPPPPSGPPPTLFTQNTARRRQMASCSFSRAARCVAACPAVAVGAASANAGRCARGVASAAGRGDAGAPAAACAAAARRPPSGLLRPLAQYSLPADVRTSAVGGVPRKPRLSGMQRAALRKGALLAAALPGAPPVTWDAAWDAPRVSTVMKPPKGHAREKKVADRCVAARARRGRAADVSHCDGGGAARRQARRRAEHACCACASPRRGSCS